MTRAPRASFSITILTDEDYRVLLGMKGGSEAFGIFTAMVLVGRERLQEGKARRVENSIDSCNGLRLSESEALRFDNSTMHLSAMSCISEKQLTNCLKLLQAVSDRTGNEPWMYMDKSKHLIIRSFFKFNANPTWGGPRPGSGRPPADNQDDSKINQDETNLKASRDAHTRASSVSSSVSSSSCLLAASRDDPADNPLDQPDPAVRPWVEPPPRILSEPDLARRAAERCEELYPLTGWGQFIPQACRDYGANWVIDAMDDALPNNPKTWAYVQRILERFRATGMSNSEARARAAEAQTQTPATVPFRATGTDGPPRRDLRKAVTYSKSATDGIEDNMEI